MRSGWCLGEEQEFWGSNIVLSVAAAEPLHRLKLNWSHFRRPTGLSCEGGKAGEEKAFGGGLGDIQGQPRWAIWPCGWSHVSPPSWTSLPLSPASHPSSLLQSPNLSSLSHTANSYWLSILHMVMYVSMLLSSCIPHSPYSPPPALGP